ncbi:hypothetical protein ABET41_10345 [Metabacillus fastidiosus]
MRMNSRDSLKRICRILIVVTFIFILNSFSDNLIVNAEPKDDALKAVVNFLNAQKNCNLDDMIAHSEYLQKISNVKELYTMMCKKHPLEKAEITDISIVNENTALVSIESTYKDRIFIATSPVIKKDGQWKIIKGIPGSGYIQFSDKVNRDKNEHEVEKAIKNYSTALKSGDLVEIEKYIKFAPHISKAGLEEHFKAISEEKPFPQVTPLGIRILSDSFAIAQIEVKHEYFSTTQNHAVCKENGQWKVIFGHVLTNSAIPKSDKPIEIK